MFIPTPRCAFFVSTFGRAATFSGPDRTLQFACRIRPGRRPRSAAWFVPSSNLASIDGRGACGIVEPIARYAQSHGCQSRTTTPTRCSFGAAPLARGPVRDLFRVSMVPRACPAARRRSPSEQDAIHMPAAPIRGWQFLGLPPVVPGWHRSMPIDRSEG